MTKFRSPKVYTLSAALEKARKYCAYQERSQQEVRDKLYDLGLHKKDVEQAIAILIQDGFINEQRFATAYAGGKFRINKWGKVKIRMALQSKKVSEYCVKHALNQIADADYRKTLIKIINDRKQKVKTPDPVKQNYLLAQYAIGRGFEPEIVWNLLKMNDL